MDYASCSGTEKALTRSKGQAENCKACHTLKTFDEAGTIWLAFCECAQDFDLHIPKKATFNNSTVLVRKL